MNWQMITALAALAATLGGFVLWVVRNLVRQELEPIREDLAVLRTAVFNHLSHGQQVSEADIREGLGYARRG